MELNENTDIRDNQILTFRLGNELYGILISTVREVIEYHRIAAVPLACQTVLGVMNLRGNVITVIDLSARLYGWPKEDPSSGVVIIAETEDDGVPTPVGMLIDGVNAVIGLSANDIVDEPEFGAKIRSEFIQHIGKKNDEFIIILNARTVLDMDELSQLNGQGCREMREG